MKIQGVDFGEPYTQEEWENIQKEKLTNKNNELIELYDLHHTLTTINGLYATDLENIIPKEIVIKIDLSKDIKTVEKIISKNGGE
jgi:hypothetical protein